MNEVVKAERPLTDKQTLFVQAYIGEARLNGTEAARLARYEGNDATLCQIAYENLRKPEIRSAVKEHIEFLKDRFGDRIYKFYEDVLDSSMDDFYSISDTDEHLPILSLSKAKRAKKLGLIKSYSHSKTGIKVEFYDKQQAVSELAKLLGLVRDGVTVNIAAKIYGDVVMEQVGD